MWLLFWIWFRVIFGVSIWKRSSLCWKRQKIASGAGRRDCYRLLEQKEVFVLEQTIDDHHNVWCVSQVDHAIHVFNCSGFIARKIHTRYFQVEICETKQTKQIPSLGSVPMEMVLCTQFVSCERCRLVAATKWQWHSTFHSYFRPKSFDMSQSRPAGVKLLPRALPRALPFVHFTLAMTLCLYILWQLCCTETCDDQMFNTCAENQALLLISRSKIIFASNSMLPWTQMQQESNKES